VNKIALRILIILFVLIILAQFFQPEKNEDKKIPDTDLLKVAQVNDTISKLLTSSCYDCHSISTNYPWYSRLSPISWYMYNHVKNGKKALNFSMWGNYPANEKISQLVDIGEVLSDGEMPLKSYLFIHKGATLSEDEIQSILNWTELEGMRIMQSPLP